MLEPILQVDFICVALVQLVAWLCSMVLIYIFIRSSRAGAEDPEINPVDLFLALLSGESFGTLPNPSYSSP